MRDKEVKCFQWPLPGTQSTSVSSAVSEWLQGLRTTASAITALTRLCTALPLLAPVNSGCSSPKTIWAHYILLFNLFYCFLNTKVILIHLWFLLILTLKINYTILLETDKFYGVDWFDIWSEIHELQKQPGNMTFDWLEWQTVKEKAFSLDSATIS